MVEELTDQEIAEIRARLKAVPGIAWRIDDDGTTVIDTFGFVVAETKDPAVADFLLHARRDIRRLLDEVGRLREQLREHSLTCPQAAPSGAGSSVSN